MNHADTLRGIASRAAPFNTAHAGKQDLIDAAQYIDQLEIDKAHLQKRITDLEKFLPKPMDDAE